MKKLAGKSTTYPFHKPEEHTPAGKDLSRKISKLIGKVARYAGSLLLLEGGLQADINEDGVLYHVQVTSYTSDVHGHGAVWQWPLQTEVIWSNVSSSSSLAELGNVIPTLKLFSLCIHDNQPMILVGGDQAVVIISQRGSILASIELPSSPTHALITNDFSNDSLTDVIVMTSNGVYGYIQPDS